MDKDSDSQGMGFAKSSKTTNNDDNEIVPKKKRRKHQKRSNRNRVERKVKMMKENNFKQNMKDEILSDYRKENTTPTILIELSKSEYEQHKNQIIEVSDCNIEKGEKSKKYNRVFYSNIKFNDEIAIPENLQEKTIRFSEDDSITFDCIQLSMLQSKLTMIVCNKDDVSTINSNNMIVSTSCTLVKNDNSFQGSGKILLFLAMIDDKKDEALNKSNKRNEGKENATWTRTIMEAIKTCKPDIVTKSNQHFHSVGNIYSFGNKGNYGVPTVSQYVTKRSTDPKKQDNIIKIAKEYEQICSDQVKKAVTVFKRVFPKIHKLISPLIDAAFHLQQSHTDVNLRETETSPYGIWQCEVCCNAMTKLFHTEKDVTYTVISVPRQYSKSRLNRRQPTYFLLKLNDNKTVGIELLDDLSFLFSGTGITHRQFCQDSYDEEKLKDESKQFYNVACYGNEKLFRHIKASFMRSIKK